MGGYDVGVAQPVVEADGTRHELPRMSEGEQRRRRRLHQAVSRRQKGSKRRGQGEGGAAPLRGAHGAPQA